MCSCIISYREILHVSRLLVCTRSNTIHLSTAKPIRRPLQIYKPLQLRSGGLSQPVHRKSASTISDWKPRTTLRHATASKATPATMNTTICTQCRAAMRRRFGLVASQRTAKPSSLRAQNRTLGSSARPTSSDLHSSKPQDPTPREILAQPTWSVRSLLPPSASEGSSTAAQQDEEVTPSVLRHLLRLSALPPPVSPEEETQLLDTLRSQLHFVRNIQSIDTTGVKPLVSIRDETAQGVQEQTIGLETLREALEKEDVVGHNKRPRRRRDEAGKKKKQIEGVEDWDVLKGASEKVGRYFVVRSGPRK